MKKISKQKLKSEKAFTNVIGKIRRKETKSFIKRQMGYIVDLYRDYQNDNIVVS